MLFVWLNVTVDDVITDDEESDDDDVVIGSSKSSIRHSNTVSKSGKILCTIAVLCDLWYLVSQSVNSEKAINESV